MQLRPILLLFITAFTSNSKAQKIDSIAVNLYTDSLKLGTYNYINVDGMLANGRYLPLDTSHLKFSASAGHFNGNSLWVDPAFTEKKVHIKVQLKQNPAQVQEFEMYIKQLPDGPLKTMEEIMGEQGGKKKKSH